MGRAGQRRRKILASSSIYPGMVREKIEVMPNEKSSSRHPRKFADQPFLVLFFSEPPFCPPLIHGYLLRIWHMPQHLSVKDSTFGTGSGE